MKKIISKTNFSLLIIALCAVLFCGALAISNLTTKKQSTTAYEAGSSTTLRGYHYTNSYGDKLTDDNLYGSYWYRALSYDINNLTITNDINKKPAEGEYVQMVDVSEAKDGSLNAYVLNNTYDCIIYGNVETIYAPEDCHLMFVGYSTSGMYYTKLRWLKSITFECFDTSKVTTMQDMFKSLDYITTLDVSGFDTSKVTTFWNMFRENAKLESITFGDWDTSKVESMLCTFYMCPALKRLDLSSFDTNSVTDMKNLFSGCSSLTKLDISNFTINSSTTVTGFFDSCSKLERIDAPKQCDASITLPNTMLEVGTEAEHTTLSSSTNQKTLYIPVDEVLKSSWYNYVQYNIVNLTFTINASKIPTNYVKAVDVSVATNGDLIAYVVENNGTFDCIIYGNTDTIYAPENSSYLFSSVTYLEDLATITFENFDTSKVTNMTSMFANSTKLTSLDLSKFVIGSSTTITDVLSGLTKLETIYAPVECNTTIELLKPFTEQNTTTEYTTLSSATNGKTLVYDPSYITLAVNFSAIMTSYNITSLKVTNNASDKPSSYDYIVDVSQYQDGYVNAYITGTNCVVYSDKEIYTPADCSRFFGINSLKTIDLQDLNTSKTENMSNMFMGVGHSATIKGYCNFIAGLQGIESPYVEGMTFVEFAELMGVGTYETEEEAQSAVESGFGAKMAKTGAYDMAISSLGVSTFKEAHSALLGAEYNGLEEDCKAYLEEYFACVLVYEPEAMPLENLTTLNISSFVINEGTNVTDMLAGLTNLKTLYAPAECNEEITLPATMYKEGTSTEYASLSSSTNSLVLLDTANGTISDEETTTPTTGFVDEQLLPALAIGLVSVIAVAYIFGVGKKKDRI